VLSKIHILGSFGAIKIARDAVCALILGSPPGKVRALHGTHELSPDVAQVYGNLRTVAARTRVRM
jgi:RNA-binding protein PNO1